MLFKKYILPIIAYLFIVSSCNSEYLADYYFDKGVYYFDNKNFNKAIIYYNKAIQIDSTNSNYYLNRGAAKDNLGYRYDAYKDYIKSYQLDSLNILANFYIALTFDENGNKLEAISYFDRIIRHYPDYYSAYYGGGVSRYELGDYKGALEQFRKYLCYDTTKNSWVYYYIGMCYKQLGDTEKAKIAFNKAIELGNEKAKDELDNM